MSLLEFLSFLQTVGRYGLDHSDPLVRKQSVFLLKAAASMLPEAEAQRKWNVFFAVHTALDERSLHLVQSVWKQVDVLIYGGLQR